MTVYGKTFFDEQSFASLRSARVVLPMLLHHAEIGSMVDVGCGVGTWLRAAADLGVQDVLGVDGDYVDRDMLLIPEERFMPIDLSRQGRAATIAERRPGRFDLVSCLEVAEHLPFAQAPSFVGDLCALGDLVLFSAAIPYQHGTDHINEQWPEFWAMLFGSRGYSCYDFLRPGLWGSTHVEWWYAQNTLVFARDGSAAAARLPAQSRVQGTLLSRVHPKAWLSGALSVWHLHRAAARDEELYDFRSVTEAWMSHESLLPPLRAVERARAAPKDARDVFPYTRLEVVQPDRTIAALEADLAAARSALAEAERSHGLSRSALEAQIRALGDRAAEQAEHGRAQQQELERERAEVAKLGTELTAAWARVTASIDDTDALNHRIEDLQAQLAARADANAVLRRLLAVRNAELAEALASAGLADRLGQAERRCTEAEQAAARCAADLAAATARADAMLRSTSWRLTAPVRMLKRLVSGRDG